MNWTETSYAPLVCSTSQSDYSSTEVTLKSAEEVPLLAPLVTLTVIDGEIRVVKDEAPPDARLPNPASGLFKLANASALTDSLA